MADSGMPGADYTILSIGGAMVGGLMPIPEDAAKTGVKPAWMGYIGVDDVDAYEKKVIAAGGAIHRPASDIPGVGRFAVAADPHGAGFILFKGASDMSPEEPPKGTPGRIGWRELHAGDAEAAFGFYAKLFGWTKDHVFDMGPMGGYHIFATGGAPVGGIMKKMPELPHPFWLYYFNVERLDAAVERVKKAGGKIVNGPMEVPGDDWIVQCLDPQGAMFAMVSMKR